jgi:hypothetical protein
MKRKSILEFVASFRISMAMRTDFSDGAEYFGEKIFSRNFFRVEATLICELFIHDVKLRFLSGGA